MSRMNGFGPWSPADDDDSGAAFPLCVLAALLVAGVVALASSLVTDVAVTQPSAATEQETEILTVYDTPADGVEVTAARTDGPIYDLPQGVSQTIVCDRLNREYLLLTTEQGGVCLLPYLDENGDQAIMPQA